MSLQKIHLRKLLWIFSLPSKQQEAEIRADVRDHIRKEKGGVTSGGGDFHSPFWKDVKDHIEGVSDLTESTQERINKNKSHKSRLYPLLRKSFLAWLNEKKRWTNEGISVSPETIIGKYDVPKLECTIKIENVLSLNIGSQPTKHFYPYFKEAPPLDEENARIGLWLMQKTLTKCPADSLRILDVLREKSFSIKKNPLKGNEEELFLAKYKSVLKKWDDFYEEFA